MRYPANHKEETRKKLLANARAITKKGGFGTTGVDELMASIGLSGGAFYGHFPSKEALFAELVELPGIVPAPYSARYHWVALESEEALKTAEVKRLLRKSYDLVFAGLPKSTQTKLAAPERNSKKRQR